MPFALWLPTLTKLRYCYVLHDKGALITRRRSERGSRNRHQIVFREIWTMYGKYWWKNELFMTLMKLRLDFHFGIYLVVFAIKFFIYGHEVISVIKPKVIVPNPEYKTRNFQNLIRKRLLRDIHWNQKRIWIWKCYLV